MAVFALWDKVTIINNFHVAVGPFVINTIVSWLVTSFRTIVVDVLTRWSSIHHPTILCTQDPVISQFALALWIIPSQDLPGRNGDLNWKSVHCLSSAITSSLVRINVKIIKPLPAWLLITELHIIVIKYL